MPRGWRHTLEWDHRCVTAALCHVDATNLYQCEAAPTCYAQMGRYRCINLNISEFLIEQRSRNSLQSGLSNLVSAKAQHFCSCMGGHLHVTQHDEALICGALQPAAPSAHS